MTLSALRSEAGDSVSLLASTNIDMLLSMKDCMIYRLAAVSYPGASRK